MPSLKHNISYYLSNRPLFFSFIRPQEALLFQQHNQAFTGSVLDFGCGDGFFASLAFPHPDKFEIVGLDLASSEMSKATHNYPYTKLIAYDGNTIPFPDNSFDLLVSNCVFEHLENLELNLSEMYRVLKPGGRLYTTVMTDRWEEYLLGSKVIGPAYRQFMRRQQVHQNLLSVEQWSQLFSQTGFSCDASQGYLHSTAAKYLDLSHYLSMHTLLTNKLFGQWIVWKNWHKPWKLDATIATILQQAMQCDLSTSAAVWFQLSKPNSTNS